jgi:PhoPQ-activated pathogenicity-related protein
MIKMKKYFIYKWACNSILMGFFLIGLQACQENKTPTIDSLPVGKLKAYVEQIGPDFSYEIMDTLHYEQAAVYHIKMFSGRWLTEAVVDKPLWWHWVDVVVPKETDTKNALLFIGGGSQKDTKVFVDSMAIAQAIKTKSIVAHVSNVPFQPLSFKGSDSIARYEDNIIAYGWDQFLSGGAKAEDLEWLARFPMTRAAVRAMDVVEALAQEVEKPVTSFFVSGASKRGWTTWTTAAVDDRVMGMAPLVIDMLNLVPSFDHHHKVYGQWSPAVQNYVDQNIMDWMGSKEFDRLLDFVEPYEFKSLFTLPKLIVNGTIDEFFVTDSWQFYWDDLPGPKFLQYVPNGNHGLAGRYSTQNIFSFYESLIHQKPLPKLDWRLEGDRIVVKVDPAASYEISLWEAHNPKARDFRIWEIGRSWQKTPLQQQASGNYEIDIPLKEGFTAALVEVVFNGDTAFPLTLTTGTVIRPNEFAFKPYQPEHPKGTYAEQQHKTE